MLIQCDFDGTVTEEDVSFMLLDTFAEGDWRKLFQEYRENKMTVGDFNTRAFSLVKVGKEDLLKVARAGVRLRDGFHNLVDYCRRRGFRFLIVSNGLDFYIESILEDIGLADIEVYSAQTRFHPGGLDVQYIGPDGKPINNDFKATYTRLFLGQGYRVACVGNGPSDIFPAALSQHVFARDGLLESCREKQLECHPFADLNDIVKGLELL